MRTLGGSGRPSRGGEVRPHEHERTVPGPDTGGRKRTWIRPSAMPYFASLVRSVLRFMPSMSAACVWLPLTRSITEAMSDALDVADHHVVDAVRRLAVELAEIFVERFLDDLADFVAAIDAKCLSHAARASPPRSDASMSRPNECRASTTVAALRRSSRDAPSIRPARRRNACTAASCAAAVSAALTSRRNASPPARSRVYQPRCLRAMRTPAASPWNA